MLVTSVRLPKARVKAQSLDILLERTHGIHGVPEIAAGFQSLLKQRGGVGSKV
ncbi:MAG TPA: hypothetical protein VEL52_02490 [Candidatus Bathyarchaeia archaeon]|nr:hypothetical protein [Candidatus Bathyarchaeia archaeon]